MNTFPSKAFWDQLPQLNIIIFWYCKWFQIKNNKLKMVHSNQRYRCQLRKEQSMGGFASLGCKNKLWHLHRPLLWFPFLSLAIILCKVPTAMHNSKRMITYIGNDVNVAFIKWTNLLQFLFVYPFLCSCKWNKSKSLTQYIRYTENKRVSFKFDVVL